MSLRFWLILTMVSGCSSAALANTIDFEGLADGTQVTTQYLASDGVTFTNAFILSGFGLGSLNELDFPPTSGVNVIANVDPTTGNSYSSMIIDFANPISEFGGYFTYELNQPLAIQAYDASHTAIAGAVATSPYSQNDNFCSGLGCTPDPNEFLSVSSVSGISEVVITGDAAGDPFTLDDALIGPTVAAAPEPSTWSGLGFLLLTALGAKRLAAKSAH